MNIVYLAPFAYSPKATVSARMLPMASALARRGHRVTIVIPPYDNPADSGNAWEHEGVRLDNATMGSRKLGAGAYVGLARQLVRRAREIQPDIIHVFKPVGVAALAMWLLSQSSVLRQAQDNLQSSIIVDNDDWEGYGGWLDVNPYPALQKRFTAWQEGWALRSAAAVTCASEVLVARTRQFRANGGHDVDAIHFFPNGPDNTLRDQVTKAEARREALRAQFGWGAQPVVIYAGTIPLNHDLDIAVKAIQNLSGLTDLTGLRWTIIATGDGIPSFKDTIARAGIEDRVEWHGFMPHAQLVERLVAADIAVYPYRDTNINRAKCSGKVIDYMACGKPMVVSDVGMNRVYLEHERSGLLTPPGDVEAFGAALFRLIEDRTFSGQLGKTAQQRIWKEFGWDERVEALEEVYRNAT